MHFTKPTQCPVHTSAIGLVILGLLFLGFTSCSSPHRPASTTETFPDEGWPKADEPFTQVAYQQVRTALPTVPDAEKVDDDELCQTCHQAYVDTFAHNVHRGVGCEACHGPASRHLETRGKEPGLIFNFKTAPPAQASEVCLKCHEENACAPGARYRCSKHAHCGVSCIDCHNAHYNVPAGTPATTEPGAAMIGPDGQPISLTSYQDADADQPSLRGTSHDLGAVAPQVCYRCHGDKYAMQEIAGPHQICGPNGFNCTTCHDPHGKIRESSRVDLCLQCHQEGSPTMAFCSSTHYINGVACTDCHNPHPRPGVQEFPEAANVSLLFTHVDRPKRLPMSVQEPEACYKCHPKIFGENALPSHHPIKEGKMTCSSCHDAHGQMEDNIKAEHVNLLCWKCHADKQGPFAYEHPPVTENCLICHNPHGTVANNLLKQPVTFLCLRCHSGHRNAVHGGGDRVDIDQHPQLRPGYYTDCTTCHSQIHGSDLPTPHWPVYFR